VGWSPFSGGTIWLDGLGFNFHPHEIVVLTVVISVRNVILMSNAR
jgi:hypothetical protein